MGRLQAEALANDFGLTLEQAIEIHLTSNHYPPVPTIMVEVCVEAIQLANEGYWLAEVELPEGVTYKGQAKAEVSEIVDGLHLEAWIDYEDYDLD